MSRIITVTPDRPSLLQWCLYQDGGTANGYMQPGNLGTQAAAGGSAIFTVAVFGQIMVPFACTLKNLRVNLANSASSQNQTFTVNVNGVDDANLTLTINAAGRTSVNTANSIVLAAGYNMIAIHKTAPGVDGANAYCAFATLEVYPSL